MKHICIICIIISNLTCFAQTSPITYTYDAAGNRVKREMVMAKSEKASADTTSAEVPKIYTEQLEEHVIALYPNPTRGMLAFTVTNFTEVKQMQYSVIDIGGRVVLSLQSGSPQNTIDLSKQQAGIYYLKIIIDDKSTEWRIVKE